MQLNKTFNCHALAVNELELPTFLVIGIYAGKRKALMFLSGKGKLNIEWQ